MSKSKAWWDFFGKIIRSKSEIPPGMDVCENCGRLYPKEDIHLAFIPGGIEIRICEECSDSPPSTWRNRFGYRRTLRE